MVSGHDDRHERERRRTPDGITVLVLADPGQCISRVQGVQERFEDELTRIFGSATVHVRTQLLDLNDRNTLSSPPWIPLGPITSTWTFC